MNWSESSISEETWTCDLQQWLWSTSRRHSRRRRHRHRERFSGTKALALRWLWTKYGAIKSPREYRRCAIGRWDNKPSSFGMCNLLFFSRTSSFPANWGRWHRARHGIWECGCWLLWLLMVRLLLLGWIMRAGFSHSACFAVAAYFGSIAFRCTRSCNHLLRANDDLWKGKLCSCLVVERNRLLDESL